MNTITACTCFPTLDTDIGLLVNQFASKATVRLSKWREGGGQGEWSVSMSLARSVNKLFYCYKGWFGFMVLPLAKLKLGRVYTPTPRLVHCKELQMKTLFIFMGGGGGS